MKKILVPGIFLLIFIVQSHSISAGKGLDQIEPADPKNQYRVEQRLTPQDQTDINNEYVKQYTQLIQNCTRQIT